MKKIYSWATTLDERKVITITFGQLLCKKKEVSITLITRAASS
jgi:hypothetical protein